MAKLRGIVLTFFMLICYMGVYASADPPTLHFALFTDSPPYAYADENGEPKGILIDIFRELFSAAGFELHFTLAPYLRTLNMVSQNKADLAYYHSLSYVETPPPPNTSLLPEPFLRVPIQVVARKDRHITLSSREQLADYTLGRVVYITAAGASHSHQPQNGNIQSLTSYEEVMKSLKAGRVDLAASPTALWQYWSQRLEVAFEPVFNLGCLDAHVLLSDKLIGRYPDLPDRLLQTNRRILGAEGYTRFYNNYGVDDIAPESFCTQKK